jgi:hypothetical protein
MVPAANRNGSMGTGGGSKAGIAIAPKPHRSKILYTFSNVLAGNLRASVSFPPLRASLYVRKPPITELAVAIEA